LLLATGAAFVFAPPSWALPMGLVFIATAWLGARAHLRAYRRGCFDLVQILP